MVAEAFKLDTTRLDVLQELGKLSYFMGDSLASYEYYHRFATAKNVLGLDIFPNEDLLVGLAYDKMGYDSIANHYYETFRGFAEKDSSKYQGLFRASYHALMDDKEAAIAELKNFSNEDHVQYWFVRFMETDPIIMKVSDHPDYQAISKKIHDNFWKEHEEMKFRLQEAGVL